jgi:hypothetical protein
LKAPATTVSVPVQKIDEKHPVIRHTPSVPVSSRARGYGATTGSAVPPAATHSQPANPRSQPPAKSSQPATPVSPAQTPRTYQPAPRTKEPSPTPPQPRAPQPQQPGQKSSLAETAPSTPAIHQPPAELKQNTRQPAPPVASAPLVPEQPRGQANEKEQRQIESRQIEPSGRASAAPQDSQRGNAHVYYPKGYHQAEEIRPVPPSANRQNPPRSNPPAQKRDDSPGSKGKKGDAQIQSRKESRLALSK